MIIKKNCYALTIDYNHLIVNSIQLNAKFDFDWFKKNFTLNVETLTVFDIAKDFNEFKQTFNEVDEIFSSLLFAENYYLFSSILIYSEFFCKHFEIFNKNFDVDTFEYITLKEIIIYDITDV